MVALVLRAVEAQGLPTADLVAGLPEDREMLESGRGSISWEENCELLERIEQRCGGPEGLIDLGRSFNRLQVLGPLQRIMSFALSPLQVYKLVVRWQGPRSFADVSTSMSVDERGRIEIEIEIHAQSRASLPFLRLTQGSFESAPRIIGLGPSILEAELEPRRARFLVTPPPSPSFVARLARVRELFGSSRSAIDHLADQHEGLRRTLAALRSSEERYRRLAENAGDMIAEWHGDGRCVYVSPNVERLLGCLPHRFLEDPASLLHPDDRDRVREEMAQRFETGGQGRTTFRLQHRDGEWRWFDSTSRVFTTAQGEQRVVTVTRDVTHQRELEQQLRSAMKMEAIGQLAGGIAHDFNNLLTVIAGYGSQLRESMGEASSEGQAVDQILDAAQRAAKLTRQLLAFGSRQESEPQTLDLNEVLGSLEMMIRRVLGEDVELVVELAADPAVVRADLGLLEQVVLNLVVNARDAMPAGGRVVIATADFELTEQNRPAGLEVAPGRHVLLRLCDSGHGMTRETQARIFEPFFTTKETGGGTGLGLAMVYGIVRQHGGYITVDSKPGQGATFCIYLPAQEAEAERSLSRPRRAEPASGDETILLVEDEDQVRAVTLLALEQRGYRVLATENSDEALRVAAAHEEIDLLLTDVVMPGMGGRELAARLLRRHPGLRVLLMSGYAKEHPGEVGSIQPMPLDVLQKPFTPEQIANEVRRVLDA